MAVFGERFRYFCSAGCRDRYDPIGLRTPLPLPREKREPEDNRSLLAGDALQPGEPLNAHLLGWHDREQDVPRSDTAAVEPVAEEPALEVGAAGSGLPDPAPVALGSLLLSLAAIGGGLAIALGLAGDSTVVSTARLLVCIVSALALGAEAWMGQREATELHAFAVLPAPLGSVAVAAGAYLAGLPETSSAISLAALIVATTAAALVLTRRTRRSVDAERELMAAELDGPCRRVLGDELADARASDLRPGEEILIEAGEIVPVDATVTAGTALVLPWRGATMQAERHEGDVIVAGARLVEGPIRAVVSWAGYDRAWLRLSSDPRRRADLYGSLGRSGRLFAERLAPLLTGAAALAAFASNLSLVEVGMLAAAVHAGLTNPVLAAAPALHVGRAILEGLRRGIAFRTHEAFDRAGKVSTLAFCARGTVLLGEPEVANIEGYGEHPPFEVLALVAGAESGSQHTTASAVLRAARARGVRPDGVRSPTLQPGLGTTAVASSGQSLVVGSRALMLKEHVSVAAAETRITELEAMGRNVLLVALGGRLIGILGLQDGLRPGARAAVQHVLDSGVEPVLLSGDARETCEALGHALAIDHLRPEIPPAERGDAIRRLADGGAVVAVVGRSPADDIALSAADVSIALSSAGSTTTEWGVQLASDDVRDAAFAIRLAHDATREGRLALILALAPAAAGGLVATLGLGAPALAPLGASLGGLLALLRLRVRR